MVTIAVFNNIQIRTETLDDAKAVLWAVCLHTDEYFAERQDVDQSPASLVRSGTVVVYNGPVYSDGSLWNRGSAGNFERYWLKNMPWIEKITIRFEATIGGGVVEGKLVAYWEKREQDETRETQMTHRFASTVFCLNKFRSNDPPFQLKPRAWNTRRRANINTAPTPSTGRTVSPGLEQPLQLPGPTGGMMAISNLLNPVLQPSPAAKNNIGEAESSKNGQGSE